MMAEILYKISQLGPGIGGGARILNKPHYSLTEREVEKQGIHKKQSHDETPISQIGKKKKTHGMLKNSRGRVKIFSFTKPTWYALTRSMHMR